MSRQASINHEADAQRALSRIVLMLPRTEANGASPSEVDAAAKHIGRLLMAFPELLTLTPKANTEQRTDDTVRVAHGGIVCETRKAVLFVLRGQQVWLPKSHLKGFDHRTVSMSSWLAREKGF